jgi:DNA-binding response OmpR family regulator
VQRILIIEDNDDLSKLMRLSLAAAGFDVEVARDGVEGLEKQRREPADLVITDIFMPRAEGIETIASLRSDYPSLRILAMSGGYTGLKSDYLELALDVGACQTIHKPFSPDDLVSQVQRLLALPRLTPNAAIARR